MQAQPALRFCPVVKQGEVRQSRVSHNVLSTRIGIMPNNRGKKGEKMVTNQSRVNLKLGGVIVSKIPE